MGRTVNWRVALARIGLNAQIEAHARIDGGQLRFVHLAVATADALFVDRAQLIHQGVRGLGEAVGARGQGRVEGTGSGRSGDRNHGHPGKRWLEFTAGSLTTRQGRVPRCP